MGDHQKEFCKHGKGPHRMTEENTIICQDGFRHCRACVYERNARNKRERRKNGNSMDKEVKTNTKRGTLSDVCPANGKQIIFRFLQVWWAEKKSKIYDQDEIRTGSLRENR